MKLTLSGTSLPWEDMFNLSKLHNLEVLKLQNYAFSGTVWKSRKGGFLCLKFSLIGSTNLEIWEAYGTYNTQAFRGKIKIRVLSDFGDFQVRDFD